MTVETAEATPFRRPTREHALARATARYLAGERVDMQVLAAELDVGRTTLYRWVGDREQLLNEVVGGLTDVVWREAERAARGSGMDRVAATLRHFMRRSVTWEASQRFARAEPALALRLLLAGDGEVRTRTRGHLRAALEQHVPGAHVDEERLDSLVETGIALLWTPVVIGGEPDLERLQRVLRPLLELAAERLET